MHSSGGGESGVVASVLATTGELARVAGPGLRIHIGDVLPLIIEAIQNNAGGNKRLTAVSTLGQVHRVPRALPPEGLYVHYTELPDRLRHRSDTCRCAGCGEHWAGDGALPGVPAAAECPAQDAQ